MNTVDKATDSTENINGHKVHSKSIFYLLIYFYVRFLINYDKILIIFRCGRNSNTCTMGLFKRSVNIVIHFSCSYIYEKFSFINNILITFTKYQRIMIINLGKWWGPMDQQPIVAIHGWQDNAGTFDKLIPLLPSNVAILAIDLPGHGLSSHLPSGQFYYVFWDGLVILRRLVKYYNWNKVS